MEPANCPECDTEVKANVGVCHKCGFSLTQLPEAVTGGRRDVVHLFTFLINVV